MTPKEQIEAVKEAYERLGIKWEPATIRPLDTDEKPAKGIVGFAKKIVDMSPEEIIEEWKTWVKSTYEAKSTKTKKENT